VKAVVDCFQGQRPSSGLKYAIDPGAAHPNGFVALPGTEVEGFANASLSISPAAKLPKTFFISTPVGNYNPDWAIAFKQDKVKHIYFIAETKGSLSSMDLRKIETSKIECARKFFAKITNEHVRYEVVDGYGKLMELVK
jgi:type III restriction enzyme